LRANTTALADNAGELLWGLDRHPLLYRAGTSLLNAGLHTAAVTYWQRLAEQAGQLLGEEHPDTLTARANLAGSYRQAGRTADAITIEEKVVADSVRLLGEEYPDTLTALANLAGSYWQAGRTADAITIGRESGRRHGAAARRGASVYRRCSRRGAGMEGWSMSDWLKCRLGVARPPRILFGMGRAVARPVRCSVNLRAA